MVTCPVSSTPRRSRLRLLSPLFFRDIVDVRRATIFVSWCERNWTPLPLPTGILYSPQFRSHQETKMAARRTQRSTSTISPQGTHNLACWVGREYIKEGKECVSRYDNKIQRLTIHSFRSFIYSLPTQPLPVFPGKNRGLWAVKSRRNVASDLQRTIFHKRMIILLMYKRE